MINVRLGQRPRTKCKNIRISTESAIQPPFIAVPVAPYESRFSALFFAEPFLPGALPQA